MPNPALPAVTSRSAWLALEPVRWIEPVLSSDAAVTSSDAESVVLPMAREPLLVSAPARVRLDPPSPPMESRRTFPSLASAPVVDTAAPLWSPNNSPGADRSEPRQSAVRPRRRAVLDEGVVSVEAQMRASGQAGDLTARELDRAVAGQSNMAAQDSRRAESRAAGARRGAPGWRWSRSDRSAPVLSSDAAVTSSGAESVALPMAR